MAAILHEFALGVYPGRPETQHEPSEHEALGPAPPSPHSLVSAAMGPTAAARRAGIQSARKDTRARIRVTEI